MSLFEIPKEMLDKDKKNAPKIKLKKGQTISDLVAQAEKLVDERLSNYKDAGKCITDINDLRKFFDETEENGLMGIDTETTGLSTFQDKIVGFSLCNGKDALYIPINHISSVYGTRLPNQIPENDIRQLLKEIKETRKFRYIYHNAKFDLAVFTTFLGFDMPAPAWDTLICA